MDCRALHGGLAPSHRAPPNRSDLGCHRLHHPVPLLSLVKFLKPVGHDVDDQLDEPHEEPGDGETTNDGPN
jgi:hypothetical protein